MFGLRGKYAVVLLAVAVVVSSARLSEVKSDDDFLDTFELDDNDDAYDDDNISDSRDFLTPFKTRDSEKAKRPSLSRPPLPSFGRRIPESSGLLSSIASPRSPPTEADPFPSRPTSLYQTPEKKMPYRFSYGIHDRDTQFGQREESDGNRVSGQYHVLLPGGVRQIVTYYADETGYHPTITYLPARAPHADPATSLPTPSPSAPPSGSFGARLVAGNGGDGGDSSEDAPAGSTGSSYRRYFIRDDDSDEIAAPRIPATNRGSHVRSPSRRVSAFARGHLESLDLLRRESTAQSSSPSVVRGVPLAQAVATGRGRTPSASNFVRRFEVVPVGSLKSQSRVRRLLGSPAFVPA